MSAADMYEPSNHNPSPAGAKKVKAEARSKQSRNDFW